jgi:hypothetical protein
MLTLTNQLRIIPLTMALRQQKLHALLDDSPLSATKKKRMLKK